MSDLIIGYGEIGQAVQQAICPDAKIYDTNQRNSRVGRVEVMHVCFPYSKTFVHDVQAYMIQFEPEHVVIWSTVQVGTTKQIDPRVVHSPVEGKHPKLAASIKLMTRWIGYNNKSEANFFAGYFGQRKIKSRLIKSTDHTEALKLLSTTEYGLNLVFADYKAKLAAKLKMPFELTKDWNKDYNQLYKELDLHWHFQKFVLDAPNGKIGGHCVRENSALLNNKFPDDWVERIANYAGI